MNALRVYDPSECDERGVPLDWERCRTCQGHGDHRSAEHKFRVTCEACDGHGSLKAAALLACLWRAYDPERAAVYRGLVRAGSPAARMLLESARCEDCGHPMSDGTWEGGRASRHPDAEGLQALRRTPNTTTWPVQHYSPCDERCRHGGPGRWHRTDAPEFGPWECGDLSRLGPYGAAEASWRAVDVRLLGWPHDLRPEKLAVLCLRCWADRVES